MALLRVRYILQMMTARLLPSTPRHPGKKFECMHSHSFKRLLYDWSSSTPSLTKLYLQEKAVLEAEPEEER